LYHDFDIYIIYVEFYKNLKSFEEPQAEVEVSDNGVCKTITANQVNQWQKKGELQASKLFVKYAKILAVKLPITFPSLLCSIILSQHPDILGKDDVACKRDFPLTISTKLFEEGHAPDIVGASLLQALLLLVKCQERT
jgi:hypothetical protein